MTVDDTFRVAFRARGEEDNRVVFRLLFHLGQTRHQQMSKNPQFVACRHVRFKIFQEDPAYLGKLFRKMPQFAFVEELAGGKDGFDLRCRDGAGQPFHARRVVHHRRNTATGNGTKNHRRTDACVGQHQANLFALLTVLLKNTAHEQCFGQQLAIGIRGKVDVFDAVFLRAVAVLCRQQGFIQRLARADRHTRFHHNLVQHLSGNFTAIACTGRVRHR